MEPDESKRWLTPGVGGIGAASFLDDTGHEIATSLLPRFLTGTLGAPAAALGLIEGLADAASGFLKLAGGALADDPASRKATAVGGYVTTSIFSSAVGLVGSVWTAGVLRALAWGARGLRVPARNALLADGVHPSAYGRAYGFERAMDNLGAIAGPLLALLLVSLFSVRTAILLSIVPGLMAAAAIVYAIRDIPKVTGKRRDGTGLKIRPVLRSRLGPVLRGVAAFEVGNVAVTLLILRATEVLTDSRGLERATQIALLLYLAYNLTGTLASFLAGR
ncbi:MAG: hypothetical protein QOK47_1528, partial [Actinomycetota bacterium]|nr:hypothetical protein [Actinomycetota bacterium]